MRMPLDRIDWKKAGRDVAVIIVGVLIALGFDNVASARADRRMERQYLARLSRDLRADSVMVAEFQDNAVRGERAARHLVAVLEGSASAEDSILTRTFSDATRPVYLTPSTPTFQELTSTGNLRVLRDDQLRDAMLTYYMNIVGLQTSLRTIMLRGKDPLGEVGWDIRAFDPSLSYAVTVFRPSSADLESRASESSELLATRFRAHPDAERAARRAVTYNGMMQPILREWEVALETVRSRLRDQQDVH